MKYQAMLQTHTNVDFSTLADQCYHLPLVSIVIEPIRLGELDDPEHFKQCMMRVHDKDHEYNFSSALPS